MELRRSHNEKISEVGWGNLTTKTFHKLDGKATGQTDLSTFCYLYICTEVMQHKFCQGYVPLPHLV